MTGLDIFTFVVIFVLLAAAAFLIKVVCALPGKVARSRNHPQAEAINVCAWLGILTLGTTWVIALIWAYTRSPIGDNAPQGTETTQTIATLEQTIAALSQRLAAAERKLGDAATPGDKGA